VDCGQLEIAPWPDARLSPDGRIKDVRGDHVGRYRWATERLRGVGALVIDAGCNCGYGASILAAAGLEVLAVDNWVEGLDWGQAQYDADTITWREMDLDRPCDFSPAGAVVAFEIIEHLPDPRHLLRAARAAAPRLLASVPNEAVWPHEPRLFPVHQRHYRRAELLALLTETGWNPVGWYGQRGGSSPVESAVNGRTLVVECVRAEE